MTTPSNPGSAGAQTWPSATTDPGTDSAAGDKQQVKQAAGTAADEARQAAGSAMDEAAHVAATAQEEVRNVVDESRQQAMHLVDEAKTQMDEQARTQRDRVVDLLRSFGDDVEKMANGQQAEAGMAQDLARQLADRAHEMGRRMDGREPTELLEEVRSFARRRPGTFLLGALAAGMVAGRVTRGAKEAKQGGTESVNPAYDDVRARHVMGDSARAAGTAGGDPIAGVGQPVSPPAYPAGSGVGQSGTTIDQPLGGSGPAGTPVAAPQAGASGQGTDPGGPR